MEEEASKDLIFEERNELMVSRAGGSPIFRTARFLKPTVFAIEGQRLKLPSLPFSSEDEWPLEVAFHRWRGPQNMWKKWVASMRAKHLSVWKSARIEEAIMCSVYKIHKNDNLVLGLAERWCSETNTFVFPWGEATITLEDIMVLGGLSVLGGPVTFTLQESHLVEIEESLERSRNDLVRLKLDNHTKWLKYFMGSGSNIEHEAFLSLWLSRFAFPGNERDKIGKHVFPMAVCLARGIRIALAPAVLASIYRDLSSLRETMEMVAASELKAKKNGEREVFALTLQASLCFVQIWAWERIIPLQPQPKFIRPGELRLARWHNLKDFRSMNVRSSIDSAAKIFLWRPYVLAVDNWVIPEFYKDDERWVDGGEDLDEKLKSFVHCLRVSELVGTDYREPYRPNRVAMQFGFDQDIPEWIPRSNKSAEVAWCEYSKPIGDNVRLCLSSRFSESDVTARYLEWWRKSVLLFSCDANQGMLRGKRSSRKAKRCLTNFTQKRTCTSNVIKPRMGPSCSNSKQVQVEFGLDVPPGFPPKSNVVEGNKHTPPMLQTRKRHHANEKNSSSLDGLAGFALGHNLVQEVEYNRAFPNYNEHSSMALQDCEMENRNQKDLLSYDVPPGFPPRSSLPLAAVHKHLESAEAEMEDLRVTKEEPRVCLLGINIPGPAEVEARIARLEKLVAFL